MGFGQGFGGSSWLAPFQGQDIADLHILIDHVNDSTDRSFLE